MDPPSERAGEDTRFPDSRSVTSGASARSRWCRSAATRGLADGFAGDVDIHAMLVRRDFDESMAGH